MKPFCLACLIALLVSALGGSAHSQNVDALEVRVSEFSGKPVPRFASLRYALVNGRRGPSLDHPVEWQYQRAGLPVLIVKETIDWRQVRDPGGDLVWIAANQLSSRPSALVRGEEMIVMMRRPAETARPLARLEPGRIVTLDSCEKGWCRIESGGRRGWVEQRHLWGSDPFEVAM
jgi:SH3-like domain-containing protein